jgi:hypothetical protein
MAGECSDGLLARGLTDTEAAHFHAAMGVAQGCCHA